MADHDRLFKELLTTYFMDFIVTFLPEVAHEIDPNSIVFLDKEIFTDIASDEKHVADLIAKVRIKESEAFFLLHVENQSRPHSHFPARMFKYFARLHEKYSLPVYPVVLFSHSRPLRLEPSSYEVVILEKTVLKFDYTVIQLNRIPWRQYIGNPNPVATALMTRMNFAPEERPKVRAECLRLLATLKLNPAKSALIGLFVENYLKLNAEEIKIYEREFVKMAPQEKEATMEMMTSWEKKGLEEGLEKGLEKGQQKGKEELVELLIRQRFSTLPKHITDKLDKLSSEQLNELALVLFNFQSLAELEEWLSKR